MMQSLRTASYNKVPVVTAYFWIIKILSTTVGETGADLLIFKLKWGLARTGLLMSGLLVVVLAWQFFARRYRPAQYWLAVVMVSIVGTLLTDFLTDQCKISLVFSTVTFAALLVATLLLWYWREQTLSIRQINTRRREAFYWLAILLTFALGTAAGDWIAEDLRLGFGISALIFLSLIWLITFLYYAVGINATLSFWLIYILTRPLGAAVGDYLSHSVHKGGLGLGTAHTSLVFLLVILVLVIYLTVTGRDTSPPEQPETPLVAK